MSEPKEAVADKKSAVMAFADETDSVATFMGFVQETESDGALDTKVKELMAMSIGVALRCEDCILWHLDGALEAGASDDEVVEALEVAVVMGGGPALMYATEAYEALQSFDDD